jgi:hypothetical protein
MSVAVIERFGERPIISDKIIRRGETFVARFNFNMVGNRFTTFRLKLSAAPGSDFILNAMTITRLRRARPGNDLPVKATITLPPKISEPQKDSLSIARGTTSTIDPPESIKTIMLRYSLGDGKPYRSLEMRKLENDIYEAVIPGGEIREGEIRYHLEAEDSVGQKVKLPRAADAAPFFTIKVSRDESPPDVEHVPLTECDAGVNLDIKAKVRDRSAIEKVFLYYRPTRQTLEYSVIPMIPEGDNYTALIPGQAITKEFDLMYYIEAVDAQGNGVFFPNPDTDQPYVVVKVRR